MKSLDDELPSQQQKEYETVADTIRGHVSRLANESLKPDELKWLIDAASAAFAFDLMARSFDSRLETILGNHWGNCEH